MLGRPVLILQYNLAKFCYNGALLTFQTIVFGHNGQKRVVLTAIRLLGQKNATTVIVANSAVIYTVLIPGCNATRVT